MKIKIAQIGTSEQSHGMFIFESLKKQSDIFQIVGYALPENEREKFPETMSVFDGYREMSVEEILSDPEIDAVAIETEEIYLTKYALMAAAAGKHIHMEKPGGVVQKDFEELIAKMKQTKKVFHTGYMFRYNPFIKELIDKVKNGDLGEIISVEAQMNCLHCAETREWLGEFPGGMLFFLGSHLIDLILQLQGVPQEIIPLSTCSGVDGVTSEDFGMAVLKYKNGISFAKTSALEAGGFGRRQLVVSGTKGTVELKPLEMFEGDGIYTQKTELFPSDNWGDMGTTTKSPVFDRYDAMMAGFAEYVRGEKENPWDYDYEMMLYKTLLKACGR